VDPPVPFKLTKEKGATIVKIGHHHHHLSQKKDNEDDYNKNRRQRNGDHSVMKRLSKRKYARATRSLLDNHVEEYNPFYASLKVTRRCRFTHELCNVWRMPKLELGTEDMRQILHNLGRSSVILTSFEGGEPLLRDDIEELLFEAHLQPFYVMLTTSERNILSYPWHRYSKYVDFLEISIDEIHRNLELFDVLHELNRYDMVVNVQTVARDEDLAGMEAKVRKCRDAGCRILLKPAASPNDAKGSFHDFKIFIREVKRLKKSFPGTVLTPYAFLHKIKKRSGGCSPNSIVIDSDGALYYPCLPLEHKTIGLHENDLMEYLHSEKADQERRFMKNCSRSCGWYKYFATSGFSNIYDLWGAISPYFAELIGRKI
jgi:MoaA/NifB/PqqE/SkfB family radical SAM enzyme